MAQASMNDFIAEQRRAEIAFAKTLSIAVQRLSQASTRGAERSASLHAGQSSGHDGWLAPPPTRRLADGPFGTLVQGQQGQKH